MNYQSLQSAASKHIETLLSEISDEQAPDPAKELMLID